MTEFAKSNIDDVSSDLFLGKTCAEDSASPSSSFSRSRFEVLLPQTEAAVCSESAHSVCGNDDDCDESPPRPSRKRRRKLKCDSVIVTISHKLTSSIDCVGQQLWRGALLLADYLIHVYRRGMLKGATVVEVGSGVGFIGVILSILNCKRVYLTDMSDSIVEMIQMNLETNSHLRQTVHASSQSQQIDIRARVLDWRSGLNVRRICNHHETTNIHGWKQEDIEFLGKDCGSEGVLWLAADVIYDDEITHHLFHTLSRTMRPGEHLVLAMEKRFNFELSSLSVVAHGYRRFLNYINVESHLSVPSSTVSTSFPGGDNAELSGKGFFGTSSLKLDDEGEPQAIFRNETCSSSEHAVRQVIFRGKRIPMDFPQAVMNYNRTKDLEMWDISLELYQK